MRAAMMEEFVRAYEQMAAEVERVVAQYPEEMQHELRAHAQGVLRKRLQEMWEQQFRDTALLGAAFLAPTYVQRAIIGAIIAHSS